VTRYNILALAAIFVISARLITSTKGYDGIFSPSLLYYELNLNKGMRMLDFKSESFLFSYFEYLILEAALYLLGKVLSK